MLWKERDTRKLEVVFVVLTLEAGAAFIRELLHNVGSRKVAPTFLLVLCLWGTFFPKVDRYHVISYAC